jgi:hypothetical protein
MAGKFECPSRAPRKEPRRPITCWPANCSWNLTASWKLFCRIRPAATGTGTRREISRQARAVDAQADGDGLEVSRAGRHRSRACHSRCAVDARFCRISLESKCLPFLSSAQKIPPTGARLRAQLHRDGNQCGVDGTHAGSHGHGQPDGRATTLLNDVNRRFDALPRRRD